MTEWQMPLLMALLGYALGSVPFGLLLTKAFGAGDVRNIGSGNIGATNVLRTGRKGLAAATLFLDMGKGAVAVWLAEVISPGSGAFAGAGAFVGHVYPVWLGFKGGKGIATLIGIAVALYWPIAAVFGIVWLAVAFLTKYSSLAGLLGAASTPAMAYLFGYQQLAFVFLALALLVFWTHRANIGRLLNRTEPKIGAK